MKLHARQCGDGDRTALLLHGMNGSGESWWRVAPELTSLGYRVIALDLPGHGFSDRSTSLTLPDAAHAVTGTMAGLGAGRPDVAIGHSAGGLILAAAVADLQPSRAVYVDAPTAARGGADLKKVRAHYESDKRARTYEGLRTSRPFYSDTDCEVEARAAERFDPATAAALSAGPGGDWSPVTPPASLMIRPVPSNHIGDEEAAALRSRGVLVRDIPGAAHTVWYSHFDEFMDALDGWI